MHQLITTVQENELIRMLNNQKISIQNVTILKDEKIDFKPFEKSHGIKRKNKTFNDWIEYVFKNVKK